MPRCCASLRLCEKVVLIRAMTKTRGVLLGMLFDAFKRAKSTESAAVRNALAQTKDFAGVTGRITLDANRNAQVPVYMLRIEKGGKFTLQHQG